MRHRLRAGIVGIVVACLGGAVVAAGDLPTPPDVWKDYDPDAGDFHEEIVREETRDGIRSRESFISAFVLGAEVRVYCLYAVKAGATRAPGLLNVHGWMGAPSIDRAYVDDGWAVMSFDYCGKTGDRPRFTKYPEPLKHGNMDRAMGGAVHSTTPDGKPITDPRQSSDYLWYAIQRRVVSYLERQPEVDRTRLGAKGYSYGGTLMWNLGTDPRIKAVVAYFGIGWNEYYRSKQVWMYDDRRSDHPPQSPGEELFLAAVAPEAHVPFITAATLWLNGSNDHHGGHERSLESFKRFKPGVPWAFAIQARGHHNTEKIDQDAKMWLDKHVLGNDVFWPEQPRSEIRLDAEGVPELVVTPASQDRVTKVEMWYALKDPCSFTRFWRDCPCEKRDAAWVGRMPVVNIDNYVFGYGNVTYDTTVVVSSFFNAAIPATLGAARATDVPSAEISAGDEAALWTNAARVEGVGGVHGFRPTNNGRGSATESVGDPKWQAPERARLAFRFYCTEPQTLVLSANDAFDAEIEITASDGWQSLTIDPARLTNRHDKRPLDAWRVVKKIHLKPKAGSDLTKVIFAGFTWAEPGRSSP